MTDPLLQISTRRTPQSEPIPGRTDQVKNSAGGYVFTLEPLDQLKRFLILGTEGGTYYTREYELTKQNAAVIMATLNVRQPDEAVNRGALKAVDLIAEVSTSGRAPKPNPAIFALAVAASHSDPVVRRYALSKLNDVCRTGTHLFTFLTYVEQFRGWGRGLRTAVADWYMNKSPQQVAYQTTKYASRGGWSHRDALRLSKPRPPRGLDMDMVLAHAVGKEERTTAVVGERGSGLEYIRAVEWVHSPLATVGDIVTQITEHKLPWEVIPSERLRDPWIWHALVPHLGLTALVRNLGRLTDIGLIKPLSMGEAEVVVRLSNPEDVKRSRIHPLQVLTALATYRQGHGDKGSLSWTPTAAVLGALEGMFYASFVNVVPTNKRTLIGLDVSGSMGMGNVAGSPLSPREAAAAFAMVMLRTEPQVATMAFSNDFVHLPLGRATSLGEAIRMTSDLPFQGTDCALPMIWAGSKNIEVDTFVVITDNETWAGRVHPSQALAHYRRQMALPDAKLVVVGMTSTNFTIADPKDPGMLDVVGFDTAAPALIADFSRGF